MPKDSTDNVGGFVYSDILSKFCRTINDLLKGIKRYVYKNY